MITDKLLLDIKIHCIDEAPKEACGFIIKDESTNSLYSLRARNISINPREHVVINPSDQLNASILGEIIYLYHSHNEYDEASQLDLQTINSLKYKLIIFNNKTQKFSFYEPAGYYNSYIDRDYKIGITDCYSLVIEYYKKEFNIEIPDFHPNRTLTWYKENIDFIDKALAKLKFPTILPDAIKERDIIVLEYGKNRNHFGVCLANNLFLHHPMGKKSLIEPIHLYKDKIKYGIRPISQ